MHPTALKALEFERVVAAVRRLAQTPLGDARLAELSPHTDPRRVEQALASTSEAAAYIAINSTFPLTAPSGLQTALSALPIEGRALEPLALLALAEFLLSMEQTRAAVRRASGGSYPLLRGIIESASSFEEEARAIEQAIEPSGDLSDQASPELRAIRERLRKQRTRLRTALESYLRGRETARYLQDQIVTDRNGRYVLVVRSEHRTAIPGIVHGASASGASLYLEPLSTVEINNDVVALEEQEKEEIHRILLSFSNRFRARALEFQRTVEAATELDVLQAKGRLSSMCRGVAPTLVSEGRLELRGARHPLLIADVAGSGAREKEPVPVDLILAPTTSALVVTGPNTGGKTVALKTAGLLALMAQAGLHIPAEPGSTLPVFRSIFADIGDEQSIAANLSTFSWHITNIASMDRQLALPALVLLDEIGAGTDPIDGAALGMAIIDHFRRRGALTIATTHYDTLKSYASTTAGVTCAAFGFDAETFSPTYRLMYGTPGRSLALEIAGRLGLARSIVEAARDYRSAREAQLAEHLAKVDDDLHALDHERRLVSRERQLLEEETARMQQRETALAEREQTFRRRLNEELEVRLREARSEIDRVVAELKQRSAALAAEAARAAAQAPSLSTGDTGALRAEARAALQTIAERVQTIAPQAPAAGSTTPATIGDRVSVGLLGLEGVVQAMHDGQAEVDVRGKRLRVAAADLQVLGRAVSGPATVRVNVQVEPRAGTGTDLNVIGCNVDEAIARTEKFLDDSLLSEQRTVRVIHGHGTGQLRRALAEYLQTHPLVARISAAPAEQGGGGVTVVELKD
jgi:DNA mismatch repair protein MutS2